MLTDYHLHTYLCRHASGKLTDYVEKAMAFKLSEIGFSDHCPWPDGYDMRNRMASCEIELYRKEIRKLQDRYDSRIKIRYGLEVDWVPGKMAEVFRNTDREDLDYTIGSIHYTDSFPFDNPETIEVWKKNQTTDKVWERYWDLAMEMASSGRFNILGHFDIPKKFGYFHSDMEKMIKKAEDVLCEAGKKNMAIEINTSGLRKPVHEIYPSPRILKLAKKHGLMLTLGSDAHAPEEVAANFAEAVQLAKSAGFTEICTFEKKKPSKHKLG